MPETPVGEGELARLFGALADERHVGVAVSGGPDSTALLLLLHRWATGTGRRLTAFTVDHALRAGSGGEARVAASLAPRLGHEAMVLRWQHGAITGEVQAKARAARYRLLAEAAAARGIGTVCLGHHRDDQVETVLMRLARGSDVYGLAGMRAQRRYEGTIFHRPLLALPKSRLLATLEAADEGWIEDPSNADPRFLRARIRALAPRLEAAGLGTVAVLSLAGRCRMLADRTDAAVDALRRRALRPLHGAARVLGPPFMAATSDVQRRFLGELARAVRGADHAPSSEAVRALQAALSIALMGGAPVRRTLGGVVFGSTSGGFVAYAEAGRRGFAAAPVTGTRMVWDGRWAVSLHERMPAGATIGPLGLGAARHGVREARLPARALASLPAIRAGGELVAVGGVMAPGVVRLAAVPLSDWLQA